MPKSELRYVVIVRVHSAVSDIPRHDGKSRRFCRTVVATTGNPDSPYSRDHVVLAVQAANAYHPLRTRTYHVYTDLLMCKEDADSEIGAAGTGGAGATNFQTNA